MRTPNVTDTELAARATAGDDGAFGELVDRHGPAVRRAARVILGNEHDADDAAQDGFLAAWRAIGRYDRTRPFRPWLMRIVINAARDARRRGTVRRTEQLSPTAAAAGGGPDQHTDRALLREKLAAAMAALPERQRLAVLMFDAEGYPHAEIAATLGVPEGTVRSDVFHARRALRASLGPLLEEMR
ncbi:MAG TPA: sigma-70 family RNA polymerase sigma factor [Gemmatimonadales bacterium]|nr:sigma-70 family RNA polymerase sigma factor [Gemmatimonadales bacterium]